MTKVYDIRIIEQTFVGTARKIRGTFKFDGRTKAGQEAMFTHHPDQPYDDEAWLNFTVFNVRKGQKIRKAMKECQQKTDILRQLEDYLSKPERQSDDIEYGVETERKLAAAHARSNSIIANALKNDPELAQAATAAYNRVKRVPVEAALGKHHDDLLEIPDFLKRT